MDFPPCHSRRFLESEGVFFCAHPRVHAPDNLVTPEMCRACDFWRRPPPDAFRPLVLAKLRGPCLHLGDQTGLRECTACGGRVRVKVFSCAHPGHRETTLAECKACPDHEPCAESEAVRP